MFGDPMWVRWVEQHFDFTADQVPVCKRDGNLVWIRSVEQHMTYCHGITRENDEAREAQPKRG